MEVLLKQIEASVETKSNQKNLFEDLVDQAIHDIQSPLEALKFLFTETSLDGQENTILKKSLERINEIIEAVKRREYEGAKKALPSKNLFEELCDLAQERELAHGKKVSIHFYNETNKDFQLRIDTLSLKRSFVNLLNNAIEASPLHASIKVKIENSSDRLNISIKDSGKGMSEEVLQRIGTKGATFNKEKGNGIGLFQVINFVKSNGGHIEINSRENKGTEILLSFPIGDNQKDIPYEYVLIDNDELVRFIWETKARNKGVSLLSLSNPDQLSAHVDRISKTDTKIYIDSELDNCVRGEFVAKSLYEKGYKNLFMTTGYEASRFSHYKFLQRVGKAPVF